MKCSAECFPVCTIPENNTVPSEGMGGRAIDDCILLANSKGFIVISPRVYCYSKEMTGTF